MKKEFECECGHYKEDHNEKGCLKNRFTNGTICPCKRFKPRKDGE